MKTETSCGVIVFIRHHGDIRYVIIQNRGGHYGFPKGHVEPGERERETALRETAEEVGLHPTLLSGFRATDTYRIPGNPDITKHVVYFVGECFSRDLHHQSEELLGVWLLPFEEALALLQFDRLKDIFRQANDFVCKHND